MADPEIRIDPLTGGKTIIAPSRDDRPGGGIKVDPAPAIDAEKDPFLEGHEGQTPPELFALRPNGSPANGPGWITRVVPNLYPALVPTSNGSSASDSNPDLFTSQTAVGAHEVIIHTPKPHTSLVALSLFELESVVETWQTRIKAHEGMACVHLAVNERREAGASLPHSHAQLYSFNFVPTALARERERFSAHAARTLGSNLLGDLVQEEVRRDQRTVLVDDHAVLLAPYASRTPYQLMIAPRRVAPRFQEVGTGCTAILHEALTRLTRHLGASPPLNLWIRTAPRGAEHFCWRIEIVPHLTHMAGLELGAGVNLCAVSPEEAARNLRAA